MVDLSEMLKLVQCDSEAAWRSTLFDIARRLGFDQVLVGIVASKNAKLENAFLQSNYSSAWRERYDADKLAYVDPTVVHCLASSLPIVWAPDTFCAPRQRALYEEASGHGIRSGITFPIHGPNGEFGVLSFASDAPTSHFLNSANCGKRRAWASELAIKMPWLALLRDYAFESSLRFVHARPPDADVPRLTRRELEVLNWVMVGKSSWEISRITACSEATVNFHLANVRQKFNVNTRQQALVKAISLGILTPADPHR